MEGSRDRQAARRALDSPEDALDFQAHLRLARRRGVLNGSTRAVSRSWTSPPSGGTASPSTTSARHAQDIRVDLESTAPPSRRTPATAAAHAEVMDQLKTDLHEAGVGAPTIRKTLSLLQAMLRQAVAWDRLRLNPVKQIRKPNAPRKRAVVALSPAQVEALRAAMPTLADSVLVGLLAYAGPRPEDVLALESATRQGHAAGRAEERRRRDRRRAED